MRSNKEMENFKKPYLRPFAFIAIPDQVQHEVKQTCLTFKHIDEGFK